MQYQGVVYVLWRYVCSFKAKWSTIGAHVRSKSICNVYRQDYILSVEQLLTGYRSLCHVLNIHSPSIHLYIHIYIHTITNIYNSNRWTNREHGGDVITHMTSYISKKSCLVTSPISKRSCLVNTSYQCVVSYFY